MVVTRRKTPRGALLAGVLLLGCGGGAKPGADGSGGAGAGGTDASSPSASRSSSCSCDSSPPPQDRPTYGITPGDAPERCLPNVLVFSG
jgi:hypothetical protein